MLTDKDLTMCQDVTPNTAEKKEMMYAITWNEAGTRMIQIGIEPTRLLQELKQNEISNVVSDMPLYKGIEIFVADARTKFVIIMTEKTEELQKIIKDFEQKSVLWHGELVDSISVSYGYVFSSEKAWNGIYDIAKAADERIYKSISCYYRESGIDRRR